VGRRTLAPRPAGRAIPAEERVNEELAQICRTYVTDDPVNIRLTSTYFLGRGVSSLLTPHPDHRQEQVPQPGHNS
jgi:hypothetical protein